MFHSTDMTYELSSVGTAVIRFLHSFNWNDKSLNIGTKRSLSNFASNINVNLSEFINEYSPKAIRQPRVF